MSYQKYGLDRSKTLIKSVYHYHTNTYRRIICLDYEIGKLSQNVLSSMTRAFPTGLSIRRSTDLEGSETDKCRRNPRYDGASFLDVVASVKHIASNIRV